MIASVPASWVVISWVIEIPIIGLLVYFYTKRRRR